MQSNDWFNAAINVAAGVLVGLVIGGLGQQLTATLLLGAMIASSMFAVFVLLDGFIDRLTDKVFSSWIRTARQSQFRHRTPLPRLIILPVGISLGVVLARLGLADNLLEMI